MHPYPPLDLDALTLQAGSHRGPEEGACVMEAVAWLAGEPWSDAPACACPVVSAFLRAWNDALPHADRQQLKRYIPRLVGTRSTKVTERVRACLAGDWLIRVCTPAWLAVARLDDHAAALRQLPPVLRDADARAAQPVLKAAESAAESAARSAARSAAVLAARSAARSAAVSAAESAAVSAARSAAESAAVSAAVSAAWSAAESAARSAATAALAPTVAALQTSAHELLERMLAVQDTRTASRARRAAPAPCAATGGPLPVAAPAADPPGVGLGG